mmetsp:Transcript_32366/g.67600  ORF Transcript_32366/g.67600 Transcript_32366/m.67600 type:complete len:81 (+) Transcript_32366:115-357(+)
MLVDRAVSVQAAFSPSQYRKEMMCRGESESEDDERVETEQETDEQEEVEERDVQEEECEEKMVELILLCRIEAKFKLVQN